MEGLINEQQRKENEEQYKQNRKRGGVGGGQLRGQKETQKAAKSNDRHTKANGTSREGKGNVQKHKCSTKATTALNQYGNRPK
jgi:hypothetical protein